MRDGGGSSTATKDDRYARGDRAPDSLLGQLHAGVPPTDRFQAAFFQRNQIIPCGHKRKLFLQ
jgi:hypothetical protein